MTQTKTATRVVNIEKWDIPPYFFLYDARTGDPMFFIRSFTLHGDVDTNELEINFVVREEGGKFKLDETGHAVIETEVCSLGEVRMMPKENSKNVYSNWYDHKEGNE